MNSPVPHLGELARPVAPARPRIHLQLIQDQAGRIRVKPGYIRANGARTFSPQQASIQKRASRNKPLLVTRGSAVVKIYGRKPGPWTIAWREHSGGPRQRTMRSDLDKATALAEEKAVALANGDNALLAFSHADRACLERSRQLLFTLDPAVRPASIELAVSYLVDAFKKLSTLNSQPSTVLVEAIQFYLEHQPKAVARQNIPDLVVSLIEDKRLHKLSEKWIKTLEQQLNRFALKFQCPLHLLRSHEITAWLDALRVTRKGKPDGALISLKTRQNFLSAVRELVRFGKGKGQLSKTWDELDRVDDVEPPPVEVQVYTPEQIAALLNTCEKTEAGRKLVPFLALTAFAGVRHEEIRDPNDFKPLLDWRDINLKRGILKIKAGAAKVKERRVIKMKANLIAWLSSYAKPSGPVCEIVNTSNALYRAKLKAGIPAGRGELTNALRSSYISYRLAESNDIGLVAREAGNSPGIIEENYLELVEAEEAARYFAVAPVQADVLPLFTWNR